MNEAYNWLFTHYVHPRLKQHIFPDCVEQDRKALDELLSRFPEEEQLDIHDLITRMEHDQAQLAFTYGVQFGILLMSPSDLEECFP